MNTRDVLYTILIFIAFGYMYIQGVMEIQKTQIREDWKTNKCKPGIIPFASYYGPDGTSTSKNFRECLITMSESNMAELVSPFSTLVYGIATQSNSLTDSTDKLSSIGERLKNKTENMFSTYTNLLINVVSGVYKILATMKDTTERTVAVNEYLKALLDEQSRQTMTLAGMAR